MKRKAKLFWIMLNMLLLAIFFPTTVYGYFDPGTGSMILQMLGIAFIAAGGFFVAFKNRIFSFFGRRKKSEAAAEDDDMDEADAEGEKSATKDTAKLVTPSGDALDDAE